MSRIEELIKEKCPDGVKYKRIESLVAYKRGKGLSKDDKGTGDNPIILYGELYTTYRDYIDTIVSYASDEAVLSSVMVYKGDVILPISSTTKEAQIGKASVLRCDNASLGGDAVAFTPQSEIMAEYLMYVMNSGLFENSKMKCVKGVTIRHLDAIKMMQIEIPVPPIEVQQEIVRILDKFTGLEAELQSELDARKKQYEYYENRLLYENKHEMVKLGELCVVNQGLQIPISERKKEKGENCYFYITVQFLKQNGDVFYVENPSESVICHKDDILVTRTGSTGVIITGVEGCFHNNFFKVNCNEIIFNKYMYYVLKSGLMYRRMLTAASGGSVPDLPHKKFYELDIPLPAMEEQKDIVKKLEIFEKICNDEKDGLFAEIAARHKQYEYYRDKLLTFERKVV